MVLTKYVELKFKNLV